MADSLKRASWLELFYDLAYVALVAQLTYLVARYHTSGVDVLIGILLSYMIFTAWWGTTVNQNLQDSEDAIDKLLVQLQMLLALLMSISMPAVYEGDPTRFFFFFATIRLVQVLVMYRMYALYPDYAPPTKNHAHGVLVGAALWYLCAFLPFPLLLLVGFCALVIDTATPLSTGEGNTERLLNVGHIQERLGLFLILVIGESMLVVAITSTAAQLQAIEPYVVLSGMVLMIALWWMYFTFLERYRSTYRPLIFPYLHAHALLFLGIMFMAAGYRNILLNTSVPVGEVAFVGGGFMLCVVAVAITRGARFGWYSRLFIGALVAFGSLGVIVLLSVLGPLNTLTAVLLLALVASGLAVLDQRYLALPPLGKDGKDALATECEGSLVHNRTKK